MEDIALASYWSLDFWTADRSAAVRNLALAVSGVIGLFFLIWRAISADRTARAALNSAQATLKQTDIQIKQQDNVTRQTEALQSQARLAAENFSNLLDQQNTQLIIKACEMIKSSSDSASRAAGFFLIGRSAENSLNYVHLASRLVSTYLRDLRPINERTLKKITLPSKIEDIDDLEFFSQMPIAVWQDLFHGFNWEFFKDEIEKIKTNPNAREKEESVKFTNLFGEIWQHIPEYIRVGPFYRLEVSEDIQAVVDVLGNINEKVSWSVIFLDKMRLDGLNFTQKDFSGSFFTSSSARGSIFFNTNMSETVCVATDFSHTFLSGVNFSFADLSFCKLSRANLEGANFFNCDLRGADFRACAGIESALFADSKNIDKAIFSDN